MANYRVVRFPNRGRGIEATRDIPQGAIVVATPCVAIAKSELQASLALYAFRYGDQAALALGDASLLNHSRSPNCDYHADQVNKTIVVTTSRFVRLGEELTIDYGWDGPDFVRITGRSAALEPESEGHRCWLLAEFYRAADRLKEAAQAYAMRAEMSADEEAWYARVQEARCLRMMGDEGGFVRQALAAFDQRPHRAEPLYDLARFCRERGMNTASILFSEAGLAVPTPDEDALFVEEFVYRAGLKEEFALAAYYAPERARGRCATGWPWRAQCPRPRESGALEPAFLRPACRHDNAVPRGVSGRLCRTRGLSSGQSFGRAPWRADRLVATGCRAVPPGADAALSVAIGGRAGGRILGGGPGAARDAGGGLPGSAALRLA